MIWKIASYTVQEDKIDSVKDAIKIFVSAIAENEPETLYDTHQLADQSSFLHYMKFVDEDSEKVHHDAAYTRKFVEVLSECCEEEPTFNNLNLIQSANNS